MKNKERNRGRGRRRKSKLLNEKKRSWTYMQAALSLFTVSLLAFVFCLWRAISSNGTSGTVAALVGIFAFILALSGLGVTLYGHFVVRIEGKIHWLAGLITNGTLLVILLLLYLSGLGG